MIGSFHDQLATGDTEVQCPVPADLDETKAVRARWTGKQMRAPQTANTVREELA